MQVWMLRSVWSLIVRSHRIRSAYHDNDKRQMYLNNSLHKHSATQSGTFQAWAAQYRSSGWSNWMSAIQMAIVYAVVLLCCCIVWLIAPAAAAARPLLAMPSSTLPPNALSHPLVDYPIQIAQADQVIEGKPTTDPDSSFDLDEAADKAEEASEKVYQGLEDTQKLYGKDQEPVHAVIEDARERASGKWQNLADKARAAEKDDDVSLSPAEKHILKRFVNRQSQQEAVQ